MKPITAIIGTAILAAALIILAQQHVKINELQQEVAEAQAAFREYRTELVGHIRVRDTALAKIHAELNGYEYEPIELDY